MVRRQVNLYLDDVRKPHGDGWTVVKTVEEAKKILTDPTLRVVIWTLDHDLGACDACVRAYLKDVPNFKLTDQTKLEEIQQLWLEKTGFSQMPNCSHTGTGYDLLCWLEENPQYWPHKEPAVHSANPAGRARMLQVVRKRYYK